MASVKQPQKSAMPTQSGHAHPHGTTSNGSAHAGAQRAHGAGPKGATSDQQARPKDTRFKTEDVTKTKGKRETKTYNSRDTSQSLSSY